MLAYFPISRFKNHPKEPVKFVTNRTYEICGDFDKFNLFNRIKQYFEFYKNVCDIDKATLKYGSVVVVESLIDSEIKNIDSKTLFLNKFKVVGYVSKEECEIFVKDFVLKTITDTHNRLPEQKRIDEMFDSMGRVVYYKINTSDGYWREFIFEYLEEHSIKIENIYCMGECSNITKTITTYDNKYNEQQFLRSLGIESNTTLVYKRDDCGRCVYEHHFYGGDPTNYNKNFNETFYEYNNESEIISCKTIIRKDSYVCKINIS